MFFGLIRALTSLGESVVDSACLVISSSLFLFLHNYQSCAFFCLGDSINVASRPSCGHP